MENVTNSDLETIQEMVEEIKRSAEIGVRYMQNWEIQQIHRDEGYNEGYGEGASHKLVEDVENVMKNFHVDLQTACEGLNTTIEEYEMAKRKLLALQQ